MYYGETGLNGGRSQVRYHQNTANMLLKVVIKVKNKDNKQYESEKGK